MFGMEEIATYQCMECPKKITHKGTLNRLFLKHFIIPTNIDTLLCTPGEKTDVRNVSTAVPHTLKFPSSLKSARGCGSKKV